MLHASNDREPPRTGYNKGINAEQITVRQKGKDMTVAVIEEDEDGNVFIQVPLEVKVYLDGELVQPPGEVA